MLQHWNQVYECVRQNIMEDDQKPELSPGANRSTKDATEGENGNIFSRISASLGSGSGSAVVPTSRPRDAEFDPLLRILLASTLPQSKRRKALATLLTSDDEVRKQVVARLQQESSVNSVERPNHAVWHHKKTPATDPAAHNRHGRADARESSRLPSAAANPMPTLESVIKGLHEQRSKASVSSDESTLFTVDDSDNDNVAPPPRRFQLNFVDNEGSRKRTRREPEVPETRLQRLPSFRNIEEYNRLTNRLR